MTQSPEMRLQSIPLVGISLVFAARLFAAAAGDSSSQETLSWLETVKFPDLHDRPFVKVTITEKQPPAGELAAVVRGEGFLLNETEKDFRLFVLELEENLDKYYPHTDPFFWPLTVLTVNKDQPDQSAVYRIIRYEDEGSSLQKELRVPDSEEANLKFWEEGTFRHLPKPAAIAVFASACRQNRQEKIAQELIDGISQKYERYLSEGQKQKPFRKFLENALSETLVWQATLQFKDFATSRAQLLETFRDLQTRFSNSRHQQLIRETIKMLDLMVREDAEHPKRDLDGLPEPQKIKELIFQLRDQSGAQTIQPGYCNIFAEDTPESMKSPAAQLVRLGYKAVPQLIEALDDPRFSRSIHFWRGYVFSHYVLRIGDCAQQILERIASRQFYKPETTGGDMTSDNKVASTKEAVRKWWSEIQKEGKSP